MKRIRQFRAGATACGATLCLLVAPSTARAAGPLDPIIEALPPSLHAKLFDVALWQYIAIGLMVCVALVARQAIRYFVAGRVAALASTLGQRWASSLVDVFASPGATLVMAVLLRVGYPMLGLPPHAVAILEIAIRVLFALSIVWAAYRSVDFISARMEKKAEETESKLDDQLVPLMRKSLKVVVCIGGVLFILQNLHVDVGSLLAGLGIGGLAFALAAKDTLANFFGSIMIFIDRPFQIGDWIVVNGKEGVVEEVGFRSTRVRTFYNSLISIPNAAFTDAAIDNFGERQYRRTVTTLNLTYDTKPEQLQAFVQGIRAIILANPHTRKDYYEVHFSAFGAHSLDVMVYFFFEVASWTEELTQRHNVYLEILRLAQDVGVEFAFPTQTLNVDYVRKIGEPLPERQPLPPAELANVVRAFGPKGKLARPQGPEIVPGRVVAGSEFGGDSGES